MGFFDKLKGALGVSGISMKISLEEHSVSQGTGFEGVVRINGGHRDYDLTRLSVSLYEEWDDVEMVEVEEQYENDFGEIECRRYMEERPVTRSEKVFETLITENGSIPEGSQDEYEFEIPVPMEADLSMRDCRWYLWATADVPKAIDPSCRENVEIAPDPRLWKLKEIFVEQFGFEFEGFFNTENRGTGLDFRPVGQLCNEFDEVKLFATPGEDGVFVIVYMDEQERGWKDFFSAATGNDIEERRFLLSNEQIESGEAERILAETLNLVETAC